MRKEKTSQREEMLCNISDAMALPKDLLLGDVILTLTGNRELSMENFQGMVEYRTDYIKVKGKNGRILIQGENLLLCRYTEDEMKIKGKILQISFEK